MTTTDATGSSTAPNYFELLGIDPDAQWDAAHFESVLDAKRQEWSKLTIHPTRRLMAERNLALIPDIGRTMADVLRRQAMANQARARRSAARAERTAQLTQQVSLYSARGFVLVAELESLLEAFGSDFSEAEIRGMIKVPVLAAPPDERPQEGLDPAMARQINERLEFLHRADLYDFLQLRRESTRQALLARAQLEYETVQQHGKKTAEVSARAEVAGFCLDIFSSDAQRARYDATLDASAYAHLLELVELAGRATQRIYARQVQQILDDAKLVGPAREQALQRIREYAVSRGWAIELPMSSTTQAAPTGAPPSPTRPAPSPPAPRPPSPTRTTRGSTFPTLAVSVGLLAVVGIIAAILVAFTHAPSSAAASSAPTTARVQATPSSAPTVAPTVVPAPTSAPTAQPPQSTDASWQALQPALDDVWGDWPKTIDLLGSFLATHPGYQGAKDKEYAALVSYASELQNQGKTDDATARLDAAIALQPERKEALTLRNSMTASPDPELVAAAASTQPSSGAPAPAPIPQPQPTPPPAQAATSAPLPPASPRSAPSPLPQTVPSQPTAPAAPVPTPPSLTATPARTMPSTSPADVIRRHYALVSARQFDDGYALMSARLQSLDSRADYASWFKNKLDVSVVTISTLSQDYNRASVESTVDSRDLVDGAVKSARVTERFDLVVENGTWRIDRVTNVNTTPSLTPSKPTQVSGNPEDVIRRHYALITARDFDQGYLLMSSHLRGIDSLATYRSWFANKVSLKLLSLRTISTSTDRATVEAVVDSTDTVNGQTAESIVTEQFVLVPEAGSWHIDQVTRK